MHPEFDPRDREEPVDDVKTPSEASEGAEEASYGGFKYKWEYDAYMEAEHSKAAVKERTPTDILLVCLTVFFILCVFAVSAVIVLNIHRTQNAPRPSLYPDTEETESEGSQFVPESLSTISEDEGPEDVGADAISIEKLGIAGNIVTEELSETYRVPRGFLVKRIYVVSDSGVKVPDLQRGDIIVSINSLPVQASEEIETILQTSVSGDAIILCVYRNEEYIDFTILYDSD